MSDPIFQLNSKVVRSAKLEHRELQSIALFAHDNEDSKFKSLRLNEDNELLVNNGSKIQYKTFINNKVLTPNESYTSGSKSGDDISILIIGNNISDLEPTILISNNNIDFVGLSSLFYEEDIIGTSRQIRMNQFNAKHFKIILTNLDQTNNITFSLTYSVRNII